MTTSTASSLPVFIVDDSIAFSTNLIKQNLFHYAVEVEQLYTPWGFIVPYNNSSVDIITYLEEGADGLYLYDRHVKGLIVTHKGQVFEYTVAHLDHDKKDLPTRTVVSFLRVLVGKGTRYARCDDPEVENDAVAAVELGKGLRDVVKLYDKTYVRLSSKYVYLKIPDIVAQLKLKRFDRFIPQPKSFNVLNIKG